MPSRTNTALESVIRLPSPDGRTVDFSKSHENPHPVRITVPKGSSYTASGMYWNEDFKSVITVIEGRIHTWRGTGPYSNSDHFWGGSGKPDDETYAVFEHHSWQREDVAWSRRRKSASKTDASMPDLEKGDSDLLLASSKDDDALNRDLIVEVSPSPHYWDQQWGDRHELFYRTRASMELDAALYPSLPTTPIIIRLLFRLPRFLFPSVLRDYLIAWFLSVQLLVLYSAKVDHHPSLGAPPIMFLYGLYHFPKFWMPFAPQMPPWVGRWQWNAILVTSHIKVEIWSKIGTWFLGMQPTYPEYTPDRLKGVLDARPGEA